MNLVPNTTYTLIRQLANPTDTQTYYVQAVVRNIITGKTIKTINLVNQGGQRFTAPYQVPADTSGQGTYISICTYVFDDAGYSVPDGNYETEDKEYLIIQPPVSTYGNGGTTIVDYDKIKKFISDIKFPGIPTYDKQFQEMREYHEGRFNELSGYVDKAVKSIKIPEPTPKYDDGELKNTIMGLQNQIVAMKTTHASALSLMTSAHEKETSLLHKRIDEMGNRISGGLSDISMRNEQSAREHSRLIEKGNTMKDKQRKARKELEEEPEPMIENSAMIRAKRLLGI